MGGNFIWFQKAENWIVVQEYKAENEEDFSVNVGDIVEAIEYADPAKWVRPRKSKQTSDSISSFNQLTHLAVFVENYF